MVFISPPCMRSLVPPRLQKSGQMARRRNGSTSGEGREEFPQLLVHVALLLDGPGDLLLEELPVAAARAVDDDLDVGLAQAELLRYFLDGPGLPRRDVLAEGVEARAHLLLQRGQGPVDQADGPFAPVGLLRAGLPGALEHVLRPLEVQAQGLDSALQGPPPVVFVGEVVLEAGQADT